MRTKTALLAATVMFSLSTTAAMTFPSKAPTDGTGCANANQWVEANLDRLPTTYDQFAKYPVTYRTAIYTKLSPETRIKFWREHLDRFSTTHALSADQAKFVQSIRRDIALFLAPGAYAKDTSMYAQARSVLGSELADQAIINLVPRRAGDTGDCSCSSVHGGCGPKTGCQKNSCTSVACGTFGQDTCDGTCEDPE